MPGLDRLPFSRCAPFRRKEPLLSLLGEPFSIFCPYPRTYKLRAYPTALAATFYGLFTEKTCAVAAVAAANVSARSLSTKLGSPLASSSPPWPRAPLIVLMVPVALSALLESRSDPSKKLAFGDSDELPLDEDAEKEDSLGFVEGLAGMRAWGSGSGAPRKAIETVIGKSGVRPGTTLKCLSRRWFSLWRVSAFEGKLSSVSDEASSTLCDRLQLVGPCVREVKRSNGRLLAALGSKLIACELSVTLAVSYLIR